MQKILFNASVILSGLRSPRGGSGILLSHIKNRSIRGIISETILDEVVRNAYKTGHIQEEASLLCQNLFLPIFQSPPKELVSKYEKIVSDRDDAHLFATYEEAKADYLVSLDKHHVLVLQGKIKGISILDPADLLRLLKR